MKKITESIVRLTPEDYNAMLANTPLAGLGGEVGKGEGAIVFLEEGVVDFGECGWCGRGHYVAHHPDAMWGACDFCGAI